MILGGRKYLIGTVRDISDIQRAEDAVREANRKLSLLSGITRHDIRNQVTIMRGFLAVMGIKHPDPERDAMIRKIDGAAERIASMIQFTKEYEEIGVREPAWQDIGDVVGKASAQVAAGPVAVTNGIPAGREVYADPLIVRVFYNLMDNALRYGGKITEIRFTVEERDGAGVIVCEDDGVGVAPDEKEKIFSREFGKNTGMGLFLAHEILGITGIAIRENGVQGTGARFEIAVPKAMFRATEPPC
jgi:signal transduction histidine kinase